MQNAIIIAAPPSTGIGCECFLRSQVGESIKPKWGARNFATIVNKKLKKNDGTIRSKAVVKLIRIQFLM
jgi:hypothetical protein